MMNNSSQDCDINTRSESSNGPLPSDVIGTNTRRSPTNFFSSFHGNHLPTHPHTSVTSVQGQSQKIPLQIPYKHQTHSTMSPNPNTSLSYHHHTQAQDYSHDPRVQGHAFAHAHSHPHQANQFRESQPGSIHPIPSHNHSGMNMNSMNPSNSTHIQVQMNVSSTGKVPVQMHSSMARHYQHPHLPAQTRVHQYQHQQQPYKLHKSKNHQQQTQTKQPQCKAQLQMQQQIQQPTVLPMQASYAYPPQYHQNPAPRSQIHQLQDQHLHQNNYAYPRSMAPNVMYSCTNETHVKHNINSAPQSYEPNVIKMPNDYYSHHEISNVKAMAQATPSAVLSHHSIHNNSNSMHMNNKTSYNTVPNPSTNNVVSFNYNTNNGKLIPNTNTIINTKMRPEDINGNNTQPSSRPISQSHSTGCNKNKNDVFKSREETIPSSSYVDASKNTSFSYSHPKQQDKNPQQQQQREEQKQLQQAQQKMQQKGNDVVGNNKNKNSTSEKNKTTQTTKISHTGNPATNDGKLSNTVEKSISCDNSKKDISEETTEINASSSNISRTTPKIEKTIQEKVVNNDADSHKISIPVSVMRENQVVPTHKKETQSNQNPTYHSLRTTNEGNLYSSTTKLTKESKNTHSSNSIPNTTTSNSMSPPPTIKRYLKPSSTYMHINETATKRNLLTPNQVTEAMPKDASCVFHIFDRRINFDSFPSNTSFYSLLRSWVQDDPYRKVPLPHMNLLDYVITTNTSITSSTTASSLLIAPSKLLSISQKNLTSNQRQTIDVCSLVNNTLKCEQHKEDHEPHALLSLHVKKARRLRKKRKKERLVTDAICRKRLKALGILSI